MTAAKKEQALELMPREEVKQEVAQYQQAQPPSETAAILSVIERVASNPDADISKLEKMLDMQERILDRNSKQAFTADLATMQEDLPRVIEHGRGHNNTHYAKLEDINDAIRPVLHKYGFAVTFRIKQEASLMWITTVLSHREGHSEETSIPLPLDTSGSKNNVQAVGSTISYGKRYGVCALLNISTGDDTDGAGLGPESEPDATDWLSAIEACASMDELQKTFKEAYSANKQHKNNVKALTAAKDRMKKELSK